jgi:putative spermidine/putrescine transport system substrate-binding protein
MQWLMHLAVIGVLLAGAGNTVSATDSGVFADMVQQAKGSEVKWFMWGGSTTINSWVDGYVAEAVKEKYGITLKRVPADAAVFVNKLLTEKQAGGGKGSMDLVWINGENFKNAMENGLLQGPVTDLLPNYSLVDSASVEFDFGYPVQGYEIPYGRAQFVFEYDAAKVSSPPKTFAELKEWIKKNPGKFTYPKPPDFTGSAFIRQVFYAVSGGHQQYLAGFDKGLYTEKAPKVWEYLQEVKPHLWQQGKNYPKDVAALDGLFERGEVLLNMSYHQASAQGKILQGRYKDTVRTLVMTDGSIYNTHFTAVPFNAPNRAGALVVANFLLSPEAQLSKNRPANWGDFTALDLGKLSGEDRQKFQTLDLGAATLPLTELSQAAVPEIPSEYLEHLEKDWERLVLQGK